MASTPLHIHQPSGAPAVLLAPMSGVTDRPFRALARRFGAIWTVTEMIASDMLTQGGAATERRLAGAEEDGPLVVQLVGRDPAVMAEAARRAEAGGAEIIDVNFGCPARKIAGGKLAGAALMREADLAANIVDAMASAVSVPVTAKMRLGWDDEERNAPELAARLASAGASAFAVHGRTRAQGYSGVADWRAIADVVSAVDQPVVANGDIRSAADARACLTQSGAAAVMVGRGAQGRPWVPAQIADALDGRTPAKEPEGPALAALIADHVDMMMTHYGLLPGLRAARKHLAWYAVGRPHAAAFKQDAFRHESPNAVFAAIRAFFPSAPMEAAA